MFDNQLIDMGFNLFLNTKRYNMFKWNDFFSTCTEEMGFANTLMIKTF